MDRAPDADRPVMLTPELIAYYRQRGHQLRNKAMWDGCAALARLVLRGIIGAKALVFAPFSQSKDARRRGALRV